MTRLAGLSNSHSYDSAQLKYSVWAPRLCDPLLLLFIQGLLRFLFKTTLLLFLLTAPRQFSLSNDHLCSPATSRVSRGERHPAPRLLWCPRTFRVASGLVIDPFEIVGSPSTLRTSIRAPSTAYMASCLRTGFARFDWATGNTLQRLIQGYSGLLP
ncbi:hypothetical protein PYCCODRAFT_1239000 [Trametes coccinea BRFM310]|uniref:Uncharacterized protein n=1 Tax=Trametes coccinea (strain BRFM310) TaxID=1353009 RepID=A0A1Y2IWD8_TRAC3|nr:hypothetical protein PYCCODRAFT_1239000 [Trametes coccinea BRFM310]